PVSARSMMSKATTETMIEIKSFSGRSLGFGLLSACLMSCPVLAASDTAKMAVTATIVPYPYELITPEIQDRICASNPDRTECDYVLHKLDSSAPDQGKDVAVMAPPEW